MPATIKRGSSIARPIKSKTQASESSFAPLRRRERQRRIVTLRQRLRDSLGPNDCSVWLYSCGEAFGYGSLARGEWDGFSDTDLLVVAANQDAAERAADQLIEALVGDDVPRRSASKPNHEPGASDGLVPSHTHGLPKLAEVLEYQAVDASGLANLPLRALTRMTVTSRYPLEATAAAAVWPAQGADARGWREKNSAARRLQAGP